MDWKFIAFECELCMYYEICLRHRFLYLSKCRSNVKTISTAEAGISTTSTPPSFLQVLQFYHALGLKIAIIITAFVYKIYLGNQIDRTGNTLLTDLHEIIYPVQRGQKPYLVQRAAAHPHMGHRRSPLGKWVYSGPSSHKGLQRTANEYPEERRARVRARVADVTV